MLIFVFYFNHDHPDPVLSQVVTLERLGGNQKQLINYPVKCIKVYIYFLNVSYNKFNVMFYLHYYYC